jgi:large subunit ribosomal protein L18Ae
MVKEFRALSRAEAVEAMYQDMAARHRARFRNVQILRVAEIEKKEDVRRPYIKQLLEPGLKFPLPHRRTKSKAWYAANRPVSCDDADGRLNGSLTDSLPGLRMGHSFRVGRVCRMMHLIHDTVFGMRGVQWGMAVTDVVEVYPRREGSMTGVVDVVRNGRIGEPDGIPLREDIAGGLHTALGTMLSPHCATRRHDRTALPLERVRHMSDAAAAPFTGSTCQVCGLEMRVSY